MKLNQKTFIYSLIISFAVGSILILYMIFMVPSLYIDYKSSNNLQLVKQNHQKFLEKGKYSEEIDDGLGNSTGFKLDKNTYRLNLSTFSFDGSLELGNSKIKNLIQEIEKDFSNINKENYDKKITEEKFEKYFNEFKDILYSRFKDSFKSIETELNSKFNLYENNIRFQNGKNKYYKFGENLYIIQSILENANANIEYSNYIALSVKDDAYYISFVNVMNPKPTEIQPVMIEALPVIIPMIILLSFAISTIFSKKIVKPIRELSNDAKKRQYDDYIEFNPIKVTGDDEISELASTLNDLYLKQNESIKQLENESKRKEIFMRSFSHQLKTPVAAASLLVDSMILKLGKFADREKYLPEVKKELNSMKRILSEILEMNNISKSQKIENVNIYDVSLRVKNEHHIEIDNKNLSFEIVNNAIWRTDENIIYIIIDNLVKNAIAYTKEGGNIKINIDDDMFSIENSPAKIDSNIRELIFEPFVTGNIGESGHGLGLYLVKYFIDLTKMKIEIEEQDGMVKFIVIRKVKK